MPTQIKILTPNGINIGQGTVEFPDFRQTKDTEYTVTVPIELTWLRVNIGAFLRVVITDVES